MFDQWHDIPSTVLIHFVQGSDGSFLRFSFVRFRLSRLSRHFFLQTFDVGSYVFPRNQKNALTRTLEDLMDCQESKLPVLVAMFKEEDAGFVISGVTQRGIDRNIRHVVCCVQSCWRFRIVIFVCIFITSIRPVSQNLGDEFLLIAKIQKKQRSNLEELIDWWMDLPESAFLFDQKNILNT